MQAELLIVIFARLTGGSISSESAAHGYSPPTSFSGEAADTCTYEDRMAVPKSDFIAI